MRLRSVAAKSIAAANVAQTSDVCCLSNGNGIREIEKCGLMSDSAVRPIKGVKGGWWPTPCSAPQVARDARFV